MHSRPKIQSAGFPAVFAQRRKFSHIRPGLLAFTETPVDFVPRQLRLNAGSFRLASRQPFFAHGDVFRRQVSP